MYQQEALQLCVTATAGHVEFERRSSKKLFNRPSQRTTLMP